MAYLRSSQNYVWNTSAVLGKGATGAVYAGLHKTTGESVAVKSFNHLSHMRPYEVQRREFEVLKKVNHENIVKLLAIEEENDTHHKVLVMELCTGGSLFNILDDPMNSYGLEEKEFLLVLKHLAAGMKHLYDLNIVHRDLKPGNIMKFIADDGLPVFKLTDFGAARELPEDQPFMSLYGTEEYLHPDMYERAVLRKSGGKQFKANVDLWSIGVTMYHIATGSLPFRPYGGRKNKETMYKITTEKASGVISGIQHSENGEIEWSRNLPKTCLLSPGLQSLVTPLLAGLLECNPTKMWTFEQFFDRVTFILSHQVYYLFYVNHMKDVVLYSHPKDNMSDFKKRIEATTNVPVKSQLLLMNKQEIRDLKEIDLTMCHEESPLLLLNSDTTKMHSTLASSTSSSVKFPDIASTPTNCDQDAQMAKMCSSLAYSMQRTINKCVLYHRLANEVPKHIIAIIDSNVKLLNEKQQACSNMILSLENQLSFLTETTSNLRQLIKMLEIETPSSDRSIDNEDVKNMFDKTNATWNSLSPKMSFMNEKVKQLAITWARESQPSPGLHRPTIVRALPRAKHYCTKIRESWQILHKDKSTRSLSFNEDQLHQLEKTKIHMNTQKLTQLLRQDCCPSLGDIVERLEDWYTGAQVSMVQSECLFKELSIFMSECEQLQQQLNQIKEAHRQLWLRIFKYKHKRELEQSPIHKAMNANSSSKTSPTARQTSPINDRLGWSGGNVEPETLLMNGSDHNLPVPLTPTAANNTSPAPSASSFRPALSSFLESMSGKLPFKLTKELESLRDAQHKMLQALQENDSLMAEFESLAIRQDNNTTPS